MDATKYIKLFNYGYFLSKYYPKLLSSFVTAAKDVAWIAAPLKAGDAQYKREKFKSKLKGVSKSGGFSKGKEKGIEPDI